MFYNVVSGKMHVANAENEGPDKTDMTADDFFLFLNYHSGIQKFF